MLLPVAKGSCGLCHYVILSVTAHNCQAGLGFWPIQSHVVLQTLASIGQNWALAFCKNQRELNALLGCERDFKKVPICIHRYLNGFENLP